MAEKVTTVGDSCSERITRASRFAISRGSIYSILMINPEPEQFGITKKQFDSLYGRKEKIRNYTFGISSAAGILGGCVFGIYLSKGLYETVLFILFFGCFLGSLFGGVFTMSVVGLYILLLYIFSPVYRRCRQYRSARSRSASAHG